MLYHSKNNMYSQYKLWVPAVYFWVILLGCDSNEPQIDIDSLASDIYMYRINNQLDSAAAYCATIINQVNEEQCYELKGIIYETMGIASLSAGQYVDATSYFEEAKFAYLDAENDSKFEQLSTITNSCVKALSNNKNKSEQFFDSLSYSFQPTLAGNQELGEAYNLFIAMFNATNATNNIDSAYLIFAKIKEMLPLTTDKKYFSQCATLLAVYYWDLDLVDSLVNLTNEIYQVTKNYKFTEAEIEPIHVVLWIGNLLSGRKVYSNQLTKNEVNKLIQYFLKDTIYLTLLENRGFQLSNNVGSNNHIITLSKYLDNKKITYQHSLNLALNQFKYTALTANYLAVEKDNNSWRHTVTIIVFMLILLSLLTYILFIKWRNKVVVRENENHLRLYIMEKELAENELKILETIRYVKNTERYKIATDMHDGITNTLVGLKLLADNMTHNHDKNLLENQESWQLMLINLNTVVDELRSYTHAIKDSAYLAQGLEIALNDYFNIFKKCNNILIVVEGVGLCEDLLPTSQYHLFRIIQELVSNSVKYAGATKIIILFSSSYQAINFVFKNNRLTDKNNQTNPGIGAKSIQSRLKTLDAYNITEIINQGLFTFECDLPLTNKAV